MTTLDFVISKRKEIREIINQNDFTNPKVFGSVAREEDTEESDIDILVDPLEKASYWRLANAELLLTDLLGKKVELVIRENIKELFRPYIEKDLKEI